MSEEKVSLNSYGRKTWDTEAYAKEAREKRSTRKEPGRPKEPPKVSESKDLQRERNQALGTIDDLKTYTLVPGGVNSASKRGRGAGFYCEVCDLTFKDNLQYVDHLNTKQHLSAIGHSEDVKPATLEEVQQRLEYLKQKLDAESTEEKYNIKNRIELKRKFDEQRDANKKERRKNLKVKQKSRKDEVLEGNAEDNNDDMAALMGFGGFGSTKV